MTTNLPVPSSVPRFCGRSMACSDRAVLGYRAAGLQISLLNVHCVVCPQGQPWLNPHHSPLLSLWWTGVARRATARLPANSTATSSRSTAQREILRVQLDSCSNSRLRLLLPWMSAPPAVTTCNCIPLLEPLFNNKDFDISGNFWLNNQDRKAGAVLFNRNSLSWLALILRKLLSLVQH